jgi:drug/metabolite transporter (DMT)-like permease
MRLGLGYGLALSAATFFALGGVIAKGLFNRGYDPAMLAEFRMFIAFVVFLIVVAVMRRDALRIRRSDVPLFAVFGIVAVAGVTAVYYQAIKLIPIGVVLVIEYTAPILLLGWARVRGRTVGGRLWIAAALAIVGCFFVAGVYDAGLRELNGLGIALAALAALIFALYFVLAERISRTYSTPTLLVWGFGFASLGWTVVHPLWLLPWTTTPLEIWAQIAAVVVIATLVPFVLELLALSLIPAARVGLVATSEPVVAAVAAWLALGERLEPPQIAGGIVVMAAIVLAQTLRPTAGSV